jgi:hypothetical protein
VKQIENDIDVDQKSVWTILNKRKQKPSMCKALKKKGILVTDSSEILNVWQEHFETVFSKSVYLEPSRENDLLDSVKSIRDHHKQCKGDDLSG